MIKQNFHCSDCTLTCVKENCSVCSLPIYLLDHLWVKCRNCGDKLYHVECLNKECPKCSELYSKLQLFRIEKSKKISSLKQRNFNKQEKKKEIFRKNIQEKINSHILPLFSQKK